MKKLLLIGTMMALLAAACSSPEPEPTPTPDPTATPLPTSTPEPTGTPTPEPTPTASPTTEPQESLTKDTLDLFVGTGYGFRFPAGWSLQVFPPEEGYYNTSPLLGVSAPEGTPVLLFEIVAIDELGGDPSQALERYADLRMDFLRNYHTDLEITNEQGVSGFSADGVSLGRQIEWVSPSRNRDALTLLYIEPNGAYGYMFEGVQEIGLDHLPDIVMLASTTFFPIATSPGSAYAPFGNLFTDFGFAFGIPSDAQVTVTSLTGGPDQPASTEDGLITLGVSLAIPELRAYFGWSSPDAGLDAGMRDFLRAGTIGVARFSITERGTLWSVLFRRRAVTEFRRPIP